MMPGVVMMENGVRAPLPASHDRESGQFVNGNSSPSRQNGNNSGLGAATNNGATSMANGNGGSDGANSAQSQRQSSNPSRMNDLPDEIQHITQGFIPLGTLLSRLAFKTHNQLADEIVALAKMPIPAPAVNGNSTHAGASVDDTSPENLAKKARLLNFVQERHADWVKAAVITRWSKNAQSVSKLIDLMFLINSQRAKYDFIPRQMAELKGSLTFARLPNPDLKTALHVLSTGTAPWMPDFNYIEPPPMDSKEEQQWIENVNTLLSLRLNLDDYDNIPYQFRDYTIDSGRVTFKVPGEFEVDLTIADEDFEKQFWFIDFRFGFTPAPVEMSNSLRMYLEDKVNTVLGQESLSGCYKFLHEFVLTHKLTEYVRQAFELSRGRWVDTLKVERLNRAMGIQYWVGRSPPDGVKSWIILGVDSAKKSGTPEDPKSSSHLTLRWFRDNKEIKDADIPLNDVDISTETLLNSVIGRHVGYILGSIHAKLKTNGRFTKREAGLALDLWKDSPAQSTLKMQLGHAVYVTVGVNSMTGVISMKPQLGLTWRGEQKLNWQSKDPVQDGLACLESVRCQYVVEEIIRRGKSTDWFVCKSPVKMERVREVLNSREMGQLMWLKRHGWIERWYLMVNLSLGGDKWCLVEINNNTPNGETRISSCTQLPLSSYAPKLADTFFSNLTIFTSAVISHITDMRTLHQQKIKYVARNGFNYSLPPSMKVPSIFIKLADILRQPQSQDSKERVEDWAHDFVQIMFQGIRSPSIRRQILDRGKETNNNAGDGTVAKRESLHGFLDARIKVSDPSRFGLLQGHVERDVAYSKTLGVFALRLEADVGSTILNTLAHRLQAIDKLADCVDAIRRSDRDIQCEAITLTKVVFTYTDRMKQEGGMVEQPPIDRCRATLELGPGGIEVLFERGNPQLRALDLFRHLVNSNLRCRKLPFYLSSTLPIQRALDAIEDAWEGLAMNNQGRVEIFSAHLDWFNIHYYLPGTNRNPRAHRRLTLQIRLKEVKDNIEWHVERVEPGFTQPEDEFKQALDKVWNAEDKVWRSLVHSASSKTDHHVGELIKAVDEAVRRLVLQSPTAYKPSQPRGPVQTKGQSQGSLGMYHKTMAAGRVRPQSDANTIVVLDD